MKLLLLVPLIAVIVVNGLSTEKIHNGPQDYDSSDEYIQRKDMNLVDSNEDSTDNLQPLDISDDKGHIEFELRNGLNKNAQPSEDCESNGGACKKNKQCNGTISIDYTCSKNGVCCIDEGKVKIPILIKPTKDTPRMNWADSLQRCTDMNAVPFVPRSAEDFEIIRSVHLSFTAFTSSRLWIPASDTSTEGQLQWWNGEDAMNSPGLHWIQGRELHANSNSRDCVTYGNTWHDGVFMYTCSMTDYPFICQKN